MATDAMARRHLRICAAAFLMGCAALAVNAARAENATAFRVCADPNNLPFSNEAKAGFENKLAELVAAQFNEPATYAWHAERRGFIRQTLRANTCDVVMNVPAHYELVETTKPYYRSSYVFVTRADRHLDLQSIKDPRLRQLKVGVQLVGDDGFNTPPAHALSAQGIVDNVVGFTLYGDYRQPNPPARIVTAVENGDVDIAAVWGPLAGYFAKHSPVPLVVTPITGTESFAPLLFQYSMAMGVRKGDDGLRDRLEDAIEQLQPQIDALLKSFGVPMLDFPQKASVRNARTELKN
jgi:quinoprotein dehydrogenase-associated probable ABC transporter substrate-binding protein